MRKTSSDLAAVAARSDEGMWASPTRPRVEPRWAHGIGMPISHPSPLFYVVAVAALAAVATLASVAAALFHWPQLQFNAASFAGCRPSQGHVL